MLRCFKTTTTTASLILLAEPGSCSWCVCSSRCKLQKVIPAGRLKTAGSCDFHSRQHISLPLCLTCCLFLRSTRPHIHTQTHTLCMFLRTHMWFLHSLLLIFFFQCDSAWSHPPLPHLYVCVGASGSSDDVRNWCWQLSGPSVTWSSHIFVCLE